MTDANTLISFVTLQHRLLECFRGLNIDAFSNRWLLGVPSRSELEMDGEAWDVLKHGVGFMFKRREPAPHLVIDVHAQVEDADRIDAWRLQQYLESMGCSLDFEVVEEFLQREILCGTLTQRTDGSYAINDRVRSI